MTIDAANKMHASGPRRVRAKLVGKTVRKPLAAATAKRLARRERMFDAKRKRQAALLRLAGLRPGFARWAFGGKPWDQDGIEILGEPDAAGS